MEILIIFSIIGQVLLLLWLIFRSLFNEAEFYNNIKVQMLELFISTAIITVSVITLFNYLFSLQI